MVESSWDAISIPSSERVENKLAVNAYLKLLNFDFFGVMVVGAPSGSGESSYLAEAI